MTHKYLTVEQATERFSISLTAIMRMNEEGLLDLEATNDSWYVQIEQLNRVRDASVDCPLLWSCECSSGPCSCG